MKRRIFAGMMTVMIAAAALAGCSSKPKETEAPATEAKTEAKTEAPAPESEAAAVVEEAVSEAIAEVEETISEAAAEVEEAVSEEAEELVETASEAAAEMEEAASEAAAEMEETLSEAAEAEEVASEAAAEVEENISEAAAELEEAVEEMSEEVMEMAGLDLEDETEDLTEAAGLLDEPGEYKVGIVKFVDHASLNQIEESLQERLDEIGDETGAVFDYEDYTFNGNADGSQLQQIGAQLVSDEVDVIVAIATPAAQIMQSAAEDAGIPIIFSAVTDPAGAKLVESNAHPGGNLTGTSDALNTATVKKLSFAADPDADKIGLLYSNSEDASKLPIQEAKAYLDAKGVDYVEKTGTTTDEVNAAVDALIAEDVDAIFTPTDNTIMNAELAIYEKLTEAGIPHYAGADSFALNGALVGFGVNYIDLGKATADMTAELLTEGKAAADMPVVTFDSGIATINTETAAAIGMDLEEVEKAFKPYCSAIIETRTAENFSDVAEEEAVTEAVTE